MLTAWLLSVPVPGSSSITASFPSKRMPSAWAMQRLWKGVAAFSILSARSRYSSAVLRFLNSFLSRLFSLLKTTISDLRASVMPSSIISFKGSWACITSAEGVLFRCAVALSLVAVRSFASWDTSCSLSCSTTVVTPWALFTGSWEVDGPSAFP
uniref:Putative secreted protein n=1 Tax=Ixodes ricinus TaxID=34613 RepID=A0A6B0UXC4_IXORI